MLETIAIILIILWLLGMVSGYTLGNFIYVFLVIAIVLFLVILIARLITAGVRSREGRRAI
jgi:ABC-type Fe3+-siderophore transport system permease subunit